jgi:hypothetical protein
MAAPPAAAASMRRRVMPWVMMILPVLCDR